MTPMTPSDLIRVRQTRACKLRLPGRDEPTCLGDTFDVTPDELELLARYVEVVEDPPPDAESPEPAEDDEPAEAVEGAVPFGPDPAEVVEDDGSPE